ncbi:hypothetical protein, partial [Escherichia coli]|uniref:hypothetical protein n=1 Tax=Escherichia coli TaxID=562 RepID=UPI0035712B60
YFCRAGGNRPDGLNEPVTLKAMSQAIISQVLFSVLIVQSSPCQAAQLLQLMGKTITSSLVSMVRKDSRKKL